MLVVIWTTPENDPISRASAVSERDERSKPTCALLLNQAVILSGKLFKISSITIQIKHDSSFPNNSNDFKILEEYGLRAIALFTKTVVKICAKFLVRLRKS